VSVWRTDSARDGGPQYQPRESPFYEVLEYLAGGMTPEEIVADFADLTHRHVGAAVEFATLREHRLAVPV
jgi:uncharacterized protein (DUF433 family)